MANKKLQKSIDRLVKVTVKLLNQLSKTQVIKFLRTLFLLLVSPRRSREAGFVLPTVTMLILVLALVTGAMIFRGYNRSLEVISQSQQQKVNNAAAPAIERAKAKLEFLMSDKQSKERRDPPIESDLEQILLNNGTGTNTEGESRYKFADETEVKINNTLPAWSFKTDANGDGDTNDDNDLTTIYGIFVRSLRNGKTVDPKLKTVLPSVEFLGGNDKQKAENFLVRNGPSGTSTQTNPLCQPRYNEADTQQQATEAGFPGWFQTSSTANMKKNFQVFALSVPNGVLNGKSSALALSTLQYQQDRNFELGNKWGAWFRYDMEIYSGPVFAWNGAMHTEGSLFARSRDGLRLFLISHPSSCYYDPELNSSISVGKEVAYKIPGNPNNEATFNGNLGVDIYKDIKSDGNPSTEITSAQDTIPDSAAGIDVALDPQQIVINDASVSKGTYTADKKLNEGTLSSTIGKRISQKPGQCPPYIDDTFRADNRFGPKPGYQPAVKPDQTDANGNPMPCTLDLTNPINQGNMGDALTDTTLITNTPPSTSPDSYGLDGYWERRANGQGLRLIVGQRLELGNTFGWQGANDPLNPPINTFTPPANMSGRANELRQRRTLRDNLAAVQATLVYHRASGGGGDNPTPVAVVATTVHPGNQTTLTNSSTFEQMQWKIRTDKTYYGSLNMFNGSDFGNSTDGNEILIDFFNGTGTNGWEFAPRDFSTTAYTTALTNLANFAGDIDGAYPPKQESGGANVHPYPQLTMWGNFSNLRRALTAANPSLADITTKQTAAATLGMLAYNVMYLQSYDYSLNNAAGGDLDKLNTVLAMLDDLNPADNTPNLDNSDVSVVLDPSTGNPQSVAITITDNSGTKNRRIIPISSAWKPIVAVGSDHEKYKAPAEAYIIALRELANLSPRPSYIDTNIDLVKIAKLAQVLQLKEQVDRDRKYGFYYDNTSSNPSQPSQTEPPNCITDPGIPVNVKSLLCKTSTTPKFPSLYYIFPKEQHGHTGGAGVTQPAGEPYISDTYIASTVNTSVQYKPIDNSDADDLSALVIKPRSNGFGDWKLPTSGGVTGTNPNASDKELIFNITSIGSALRRIPIKDSAFFDGRESMSIRALNIDLSMLRTNQISGENWLPNSGVVYAFREDAVREDAIARPAGTLMTVNSATPKDPTLTTRGISTKSVDMWADPDRRPYGFRLRNGSRLDRPQAQFIKGLSFISDNPVYVQGAFNLHTNSSSTANTLDEFNEAFVPPSSNTAPNPVKDDSSTIRFYNKTNTTLNANFAKPSVDRWRPSEIIADAIAILSNNACDGSIEDGIIYAGDTDPKGTGKLSGADRATKYGCNSASDYTSYITQNRPIAAVTVGNTWQRENPYEVVQSTATGRSPVYITRQGVQQIVAIPVTAGATVVGSPTAYTGNYLTFDDGTAPGKRRITAAETTANMVLVSGIVPTGLNRTNGGFHNFHRLLEGWPSIRLNFRGSMIQLNFSNYATGQYDQTPWEPQTGAITETNERINYYQAPTRAWGYDVGLQYQPPSPIASRFASVPNARDEFYRELPADDPYICLLRKQLKTENPSSNIDSGCN